ncbi:unnamed protein product [Schistosoma curassoni]|uniref:Secreted protein n=1 Tax=Schistosoma curassoni TaxID=6186 RepID=A0A183L3C0_9TREM|nr:unnamed protein product [Schistosoma curassoni]
MNWRRRLNTGLKNVMLMTTNRLGVLVNLTPWVETLLLSPSWQKLLLIGWKNRTTMTTNQTNVRYRINATVTSRYVNAQIV